MGACKVVDMEATQISKGQAVTGRDESGTLITGTVVKHYAFGATAIVDKAGQVHVVDDATVMAQ